MVVKILEVEPLTHDVKRFVVEKPKGFTFTPGQATEVSVNKDGWKDKKRPFTFTSLVSDENLEFIIKGYPLEKYPDHGGVTEQIHKLKEGDEFIIGKTWGAIKYGGIGTFIAGGAGIAAFIAIIRQLKSRGELEGNRLIFSNKSAKDVILEGELRNMFKNGDLILTLTREEKEGYYHGRVDKSFIESNVSTFSQRFYICGPKQMVKDVNAILGEFGVKTDSLIF